MKANQFIKNEKGYSNLVPLALAIVITFAMLFIGSFVNGEIYDSLEDTYPSTATDRTVLQNSSIATMDNVSANFDSSLDIVQIVIIITLLAGAIGAIFLFTRFR